MCYRLTHLCILCISVWQTLNLFLLFNANKMFVTFTNGSWLMNIISIFERLKVYPGKYICVWMSCRLWETPRRRVGPGGGGGPLEIMVIGYSCTHIVVSSESTTADPLKNGFFCCRTSSTQQANNSRNKQHTSLFEGHQEFA